LAGQELSTTYVGVMIKGLPAWELAQKLRFSQPPIIPRVQKDEVLLDLRTVEDIQEIVKAFQAIVEGK
jgi:seryl-tRNA(Sec) selenium transferase